MNNNYATTRFNINSLFPKPLSRRNSRLLFHNITLYSENNRFNNNNSSNQQKSSQFIFRAKYRFENSMIADIYLTNRNKFYATYNAENGFLNGRYHNNTLAIDKYRIYSNQNNKVKWAIGHYAIGFGSRLTFDNSTKTSPNGIQFKNPYKINYVMGKINNTSMLRGIAVQGKYKAPSGYVDLAFFSSSQLLDIYQNNIEYGPDEWNAPVLGECDNINASSGPYVCQSNQLWLTNTIRDNTNIKTEIRHANLENALKEELIGQHFAWIVANHRLGIIHYNAKTKLLINAPGRQLSVRSRFPNISNIYASGIYYQYRGNYEIDTEISQFNKQGLAAYFHWRKELEMNKLLDIAFRYYNKEFSNPYAKSETAFYASSGFNRRNEIGVKLSFSEKYGIFHSKSIIDIWRSATKESEIITSENNFSTDPDLLLQQSFEWHFRHSFTLGLFAELVNKNIGQNGRKESFKYIDEFGNGERRTVKLLIDKKFTHYRHILSYTYRWQDVAVHSDKFSKEQYIRYYGKYSINPKTKLGFLANYKIRYIPYKGTYNWERMNDKLNSSLIINQRISVRWSSALRIDTVLLPDKDKQKIAASFQLSYYL